MFPTMQKTPAVADFMLLNPLCLKEARLTHPHSRVWTIGPLSLDLPLPMPALQLSEMRENRPQLTYFLWKSEILNSTCITELR